VNRLRSRLDEKKLKFGSVDKVMDVDRKVFRVVVKGIDPAETDRARKLVEATLPGYAVVGSASDLTYDLPSARVADTTDAAVQEARNTIEERINATGVVDPLIQRQGLNSDRILIQIPGASDPEAVKQLIGRVAFLELKLVDSQSSSREDLISRHQGTLPANL